ncbi:pilus assembly PilX family protein [Ectothiorhodospira marina]|jgi:hypothetical protein|uniref:PilX N-terminal n=1 Tax=Ectothiorhodospira marina TaxID=1396821 RepID=A0A1H7NZG0_9GAMM|nr:pilus assembly PilX N-terminal domain-containing protein [Ectothiorhodospira marina]SEL29010.1 PilX N-terminal [Ectothiorhodospira marina]
MRYRPVKEQGAVLIVSLVMLSLATLIGVSGMSSAHLQERIAGNQKQGTDAFMAAETGVAEVLRASREVVHWPDVDELLTRLSGEGPHPLPDGQTAQWWIPERPEASGSTMSVLVAGGVGSTAAQRTLKITLGTGFGGPHPEGAYHCFGPACTSRAEENFDLGDLGLAFDGRLWPLPDREDGYTCESGQCPEDPPHAVEDALPLPGLFAILEGSGADGAAPREVAHSSDQVQGQPTPILVSDGMSTGGGGDANGTLAEDWRNYVNQLISHPDRKHVMLDGDTANTVNGVSVKGETVYVQDFMGSHEAPRIHYVEGEGSIGLGGHEHGAGILVISDAITLTPSSGTSVTFEGLVILLEGAQLEANEATVNIFGSVVSLAGEDGNLFDDLSGNINIRYSPEAMDNLREHGLWDAAVTHPMITAWQEVM